MLGSPGVPGALAVLAGLGGANTCDFLGWHEPAKRRAGALLKYIPVILGRTPHIYLGRRPTDRVCLLCHNLCLVAVAFPLSPGRALIP